MNKIKTAIFSLLFVAGLAGAFAFHQKEEAAIKAASNGQTTLYWFNASGTFPNCETGSYFRSGTQAQLISETECINQGSACCAYGYPESCVEPVPDTDPVQYQLLENCEEQPVILRRPLQ